MEKKIIVVTGGSSGIGLQTIKQLSEEKQIQIISFSRSKRKIENAIRKLQVGDNVSFFEGDVTNINDCQQLATYLEKNYGVLHGLVNNAGILTKGGIEAINVKDWKYNLDVNLNGVYQLIQTLLPLMKKAGGSSIVNISSIASSKPGSSIAYSVSKAGLDMLTEFLAGDLGPYDIRVNSVNPGLVRTPLHIENKIMDNTEDYEEMLRKSTRKYPLKRIGSPEDIANLIVFLLSEKSSWITGSLIKIDGGASVFNDLIPPKDTTTDL